MEQYEEAANQYAADSPEAADLRIQQPINAVEGALYGALMQARGDADNIDNIEITPELRSLAGQYSELLEARRGFYATARGNGVCPEGPDYLAHEDNKQYRTEFMSRIEDTNDGKGPSDDACRRIFRQFHLSPSKHKRTWGEWARGYDENGNPDASTLVQGVIKPMFEAVSKARERGYNAGSF